MRSKIKRTAICVMVFGLPISLPQSGPDSVFGISIARADGTLNRLMRWTGYGWSSGYHACRNDQWSVQDALPPVGNTAGHGNHLRKSGFELVSPQTGVYPVAHPSSHASVQSLAPVGVSPIFVPGYIGGSLVHPQSQPPSEVIQPYRSAVPPKVQKEAVDSEERNAVSPSDMEPLPLPKGRTKANNNQDDLLLDDDHARLIAPQNRSATATNAHGGRSR
jgi:hypothetical protein